jgi:hypothetical protein
MSRGWLFAVLLVLLSALVGPAVAQQNPLLGGQTAANSDEPIPTSSRGLRKSAMGCCITSSAAS